MIQNSTNFNSIRRATFFLLFAIFPATLTVIFNVHCTRSSEGESLQANKDTVVMALTSGPASLDPRIAGDAIGIRILNLIFSGLTRVDSDLELSGDAATSWTLKANEYTFALRSDITFSNGRALTVDDLNFSFHEFTNSGTGKDSTFATVDKIACRYDQGGHWVKIHFKKYTASLLRDLSRIKFIPHAEAVKLGQEFALHPLGTGPFSFVSQSHSTIVLRARKDLGPLNPSITNLVFKIIRDDNTRLFKLIKGEIDIAQQELGPAKVKMIKNNPDFTVVSHPGLSVTYLIFNLRDPLLKKLDLRRALDQSIDRNAIVKYKQLGMALPASSFLAPANRYHNFEIEPTRFDPEAAVKLLKTIKGLAGEEFTLKTGNNPSSMENGRVIANQWNQVLAQIGVHLRTQSYEWGTYYGDVQRGNFQIALMRWTSLIDPNIYRNCFYSTELPPDGKNRSYYKNPQLDALLDQGVSTSDEAIRKKIYDKIQKIVSDDRPVLPLWYENEVTVYNKRVKNYIPSVYGDFYALTKVSKSN